MSAGSCFVQHILSSLQNTLVKSTGIGNTFLNKVLLKVLPVATTSLFISSIAKIIDNTFFAVYR
jgi:predicted nucleotidyltransferase